MGILTSWDGGFPSFSKPKPDDCLPGPGSSCETYRVYDDDTKLLMIHSDVSKTHDDDRD